MANTDRQILPLTDPTIALDPMSIEDFESPDEGSGNANSSPTMNKASQISGTVIPLIQINSTQLKQEEISFFSISISGFLPSAKLVISDVSNRFGDRDYPKDGDIVSVFIKPPDDEVFKEIRIDFDIISIKFVSSNPNLFTLECSMKVPNLHAEDCEAFEEASTFAQINLVADNLGLGYASNESETLDPMVRIRPYDTNLKFINDLTLQAYKDDDSFWTSYIDPYYYLCFVNINKQFSTEDLFEDATISIGQNPNRDGTVTGEPASSLTTLFLSNEEAKRDSDMYINNYGLTNISGKTWRMNGYKRYCQYYDDFVREWNEFFVDPLTTEGAEKDLILQKGRADETFYESQVKYKYLGKQVSGGTQLDGYNMHENYIFAQILNYQNLKEINKMALTVEMPNMNFNLYRYQRIPISIYNGDPNTKRLNEKRDEELGEEETKDNETEDSTETPGAKTKNEFLSGYYVIDSIEYIYKGAGIGMKLNCLRREWPIPVENIDY